MPKATQAIRTFFKNIRSMVVSKDDLNEKDTVILVIGTAGSGKTSFVNKVAQFSQLQVSAKLAGGTKKVSHVRCTPKTDIPRVVLVDTPPIPDDSGEKEILDWLKHIKKVNVRGIIYLHQITLNRCQPEKHYTNLRRLSDGKLNGVPVILVTTLWTPEKEIYEARRRDLQKDWESADIPGLLPTTYDNTEENAWDIVSDISKEGGVDLEKHHIRNAG